MNNIKEVLVLHHTHTDIGYTHPQPVFWDLSRRYIDEALELCEATADWPEASRMRWTCEVTAPVLQWIRQADERKLERMRAMVHAGQMSFGAMFVNGTPLCTAAEIAQTLYAVRIIREALGAPVSVAVNHDINGHSWPMVGLLRDAGVEALLMGINLHSGVIPFGVRPRVFRWQGSDGRELLAWSGEHYNLFNPVTGRMPRPERYDLGIMRDGLNRYFKKLEASDYPYDFAYLTATHYSNWDNAPPDRSLPSLVAAWNAQGEGPEIKLVTPEMFVKRLKKIPVAMIPVHRGDWMDGWGFGVGSSALETGVIRRNHAIWTGAQLADAVLPADAERAARLGEGFWNMAISDEHTWGAFCSTPTLNGGAEPDAVAVAEQWIPKAGYAYQARSLLSLAQRDALESLAVTPEITGQRNAGVMFYNPAPVARRMVVRIPRELTSGEWVHDLGRIHHLDVLKQLVRPDNSMAVGPLELPPCSLVKIPLAGLKPAALPAGTVARKGLLRTTRFELRYDSKSGRVTSLRDRRLKKSLLDVSSPWECFGYVRETVAEPSARAKETGDLRDCYFENRWEKIHQNVNCWNPDWKARHEMPIRCLNTEALVSPEGAVLVREYRAPGVSLLRQTITLLAHEEKIRFEAVLQKDDHMAPEGIYFTFPLALPGRQIHYDAAGMSTEYGRETLPGCTLDLLQVSSWVAAHTPTCCVTLACPDAPLFQVGGFTFGRRITAPMKEKKALLLAWPLNNYWCTNFRGSQPGTIRLVYEMRVDEAFDAASCARFGVEAQTAVEVHPLTLCEAPAIRSLIDLKGGDDVVLLQVKRAGNKPRDLVVRLANHADSVQTVRLRLPGMKIGKAFLCNTLEQPQGRLVVKNGCIIVPVAPRQIAGVRMTISL